MSELNSEEREELRQRLITRAENRRDHLQDVMKEAKVDGDWSNEKLADLAEKLADLALRENDRLLETLNSDEGLVVNHGEWKGSYSKSDFISDQTRRREKHD